MVSNVVVMHEQCGENSAAVDLPHGGCRSVTRMNETPMHNIARLAKATTLGELNSSQWRVAATSSK